MHSFRHRIHTLHVTTSTQNYSNFLLSWPRVLDIFLSFHFRLIFGSSSFCFRIGNLAKLNQIYTDVFPEAIKIARCFCFLRIFMISKLWFSISALCCILNVHISKFLQQCLMHLDQTNYASSIVCSKGFLHNHTVNILMYNDFNCPAFFIRCFYKQPIHHSLVYRLKSLHALHSVCQHNFIHLF